MTIQRAVAAHPNAARASVAARPAHKAAVAIRMVAVRALPTLPDSINAQVANLIGLPMIAGGAQRISRRLAIKPPNATRRLTTGRSST